MKKNKSNQLCKQQKKKRTEFLCSMTYISNKLQEDKAQWEYKGE